MMKGSWWLLEAQKASFKLKNNLKKPEMLNQGPKQLV